MKLLITTIAAVVLVGCGPSVPDISIHEAAKEGNIEAVKQHLAAGANVNAIIVSGRYQGKTPLDLAIRLGQTETIDLLRKQGGKTGEELKAAEPVAEASQAEPPTAKAPDISIHDAIRAGHQAADWFPYR